MTQLDTIKAPVAQELTQYEEYLRSMLKSDDAGTQKMLDYIFENRGKAVRPLMALLCAAICNGGTPLPGESRMAAMLLEMIHTATLVHDDVIDEAFVRRGKHSVNALWRAQRAVLIGDFILAKSFRVGIENQSYNLISYITEYLPALCEGELRQSQLSDSLEMTREIYLDVIYKKTATLIGTSCGVGALSVGAPTETVTLAKRMGVAIGMAFQIRDDILDYSPASTTGKPLCGDLRERKITLPLLTVLEKSPTSERRRILRLLSGVRSRPENVEKIHSIVLERDGIGMASRVMDEYVNTAMELIELLPESEYRTSLRKLFLFIAEREV